MITKEITFVVDEQLIAAAQARAKKEDSSLEEAFELWLKQYAEVEREQKLKDYNEVIQQLQGKLRVGKKLTRDEMNER